MALGALLRHRRVFTAVKYIVYSLLILNVFLFLQEELLSLDYTFRGGLQLGQVVQVFASTIDTAAWVILLLLFELETSVLDDSRLRGALKYAIHWVRLLCSLAIVYAFTGYCAELITLYQTQPMTMGDCAALGEGWSVLAGLDKYAALSSADCQNLVGPLVRLEGFSIVAPAPALQDARLLAWTDVINAGAWILVVIVLEIEVRLQLRGRLTDAIVHGTRYLKYAVYSVLFLAAAYWGMAGDFIDVWDASLWLFAFIFIELNVFDWQQESRAGA